VTKAFYPKGKLERTADEILHKDAQKKWVKKHKEETIAAVLTDEQIRDGMRLTEKDLGVLNDLPHNPGAYENPQVRLAALAFKAKYTLEEKRAQESDDKVTVTITRAKALPPSTTADAIVDGEMVPVADEEKD